MKRFCYKLLAAVVLGLFGAGIGKIANTGETQPGDELAPIVMAIVFGGLAFAVCSPKAPPKTEVHVHIHRQPSVSALQPRRRIVIRKRKP